MAMCLCYRMSKNSRFLDLFYEHEKLVHELNPKTKIESSRLMKKIEMEVGVIECGN